jgi:lysine 2,3-aminomutase
MQRLAAIPHLGVIRLHSRVPVVDPERITPDLVDALKSAGDKAVWLLLHANHEREFVEPARAAIARLVDAGIPVLGQSVLLRGVNDTPETLAGLFRAMVRNRIKPHYLHHGDLARGTSHFRVSLAEGQALMRSLRGRHSGLMQPTYILDIPGGHGKVPVGPVYAAPREGGDGWDVTDPWGCSHHYDDPAVNLE